MSELTILQKGIKKTLFFEGEALVDDLLKEAGAVAPHPCGGHGKCGKCKISISGAVLPPNEAEIKAKTRLSCQARVFGDATVILPDGDESAQIETETGSIPSFTPNMGEGYGAAVDIGTTTIAVKVFDLSDGSLLGTSSALNPQASVAADVMGRIEAAINGDLPLLSSLVTDTLKELIIKANPDKKIPDTLVVTGNTTMLYLLMGLSPKSLSSAPFKADNLFGIDTRLLASNCYLPPCMNAFVGADITCAVLASGMCEKNEISLLCDIGTNGEIALFKEGRLYVTSTAAGPAFEGAGISCGCSSVDGAIDKVTADNSEIKIHTINEKSAVGLCGSGLIDAVAAGLKLGLIDETGAMDDDLILSENVSLQPKDIRAVQLAKAAIAAGIKTLLQISDTKESEIERLYIAGGFGSHLNIQSAADIGLIPNELTDRTTILGNAALSGAIRVLLCPEERQKLEGIAELSEHINLGGNPKFNENYIEEMLFPE
ncbi:MAG: DUF4445 domain-containing protein [Clostridia bacterium]|nr:DUF4445 domain-containing protein [Clostridia bacterium]